MAQALDNIPLSWFWDLLVRVEATFHLPQMSEQEETTGGEIIDINIGPRLWTGSVRVKSDSHDVIDAAAARMESALETGASFMLRPPHRRGPVNDPKGTTLGAAVVTLSSVNANRRDVTLAGLPVGYNPGVGSFLSFAYGTRQAFHRITESNGANVTVLPAIRDGFAAGAAVKLMNPEIRAKVVKDSYKPPQMQPGVSRGFSFEWRQTLGAN